MARTTLDLDTSVLRELRRRSKRAHKSMGALASELLAQALHEREPAQDGDSFSWTASDLGRPLVDLQDREAVQRALDGRA